MTNPNESNEAMRSEFESWINATYGHDCIRRDEEGDYADIATCSQWDAWQAAQASLATPQQTVRSEAEPLYEALMELISVKLFAAEHTDKYTPRQFDSTESEAEYKRRKPLAWLNARQAVARYLSIRALIEPLSVTDSVAVQELVWKIQAEVLERMADILVVEIKDNSHNAMFRSGVDIAAHRLRVRAQMLMDFQEFDRFPSLSPTLDKEAK